VRSYLGAAFQHAAKSDHDPIRLAREGPLFEVAVNPAGQVPRKAEFESVGERHLSVDELRRFWQKALFARRYAILESSRSLVRANRGRRPLHVALRSKDAFI